MDDSGMCLCVREWNIIICHFTKSGSTFPVVRNVHNTHVFHCQRTDVFEFVVWGSVSRCIRNIHRWPNGERTISISTPPHSVTLSVCQLEKNEINCLLQINYWGVRCVMPFWWLLLLWMQWIRYTENFVHDNNQTTDKIQQKTFRIMCIFVYSYTQGISTRTRFLCHFSLFVYCIIADYIFCSHIPIRSTFALRKPLNCRPCERCLRTDFAGKLIPRISNA